MKLNTWINIGTGLILGLAVLLTISLAWIAGTYTPNPELVYHGYIQSIIKVGSSPAFLTAENTAIESNYDIRLFENGEIVQLTDYDIWFGGVKSISSIIPNDYYIYKVHPSSSTTMYYLLSQVKILSWQDITGWSKLSPRKNIAPQSWESVK